MADQATDKGVKGAAAGIKTDRSQQRALSRAAKTGGYVMGDDEKYCLQIVRNANKACKIAAERIQAGKPLSPEVMQSCTVLSSAMSQIMFA